jgi:hypothetical protein
MILEAQLVIVEEDIALLAQQERGKIRKEARESLIGEKGHVAQAEIVEGGGSYTRRRALLCSGVLVILLAINIVGIVLGTKHTSSMETKCNIHAINDGTNHVF